MMKIFISHSNKNKKYVHDLVEAIGRDKCIVDCYDFESAYQTIAEINKAIGKAYAFVMLISKQSLESEWVKNEVRQAVLKLDPEGMDRFWAYIIDPELTYNDLPEWLERVSGANIHNYNSPKILAKDIRQKYRRLAWRNNPQLKIIEASFVGRNKEFDEFQQALYSHEGSGLRSVIISGRRGVGKESFAKKCMKEVDHTLYSDPFIVNMPKNSSIEEFISAINDITCSYPTDSINEILKDAGKTKKIQIVVEELNKIFKFGADILIEDDLSCVLSNRNVADWLTKVLECDKLEPYLGCYVNSQIAPNNYISYQHPEILHIHLDMLSPLDKRMLFFKLAREYGLQNEITEKDANFFLEKLHYSPRQIKLAIATIKNKGLRAAKADINYLVEIGDKAIAPLISSFMEDSLKRDLLLVISRFQFISCDILYSIFEEEEKVDDIISEMLVYGLVSTFGPSGEFIQLDEEISDYLSRNKQFPSREIENRISEVVENYLTNGDLNKDTSAYMYDLRQRLIKGTIASKDIVYPSVVVKSVIEAYNNRDYDTVITICDKFLEYKNKYFDEVNNELTYWLCLAFCRKAKDNYDFGKRFKDTIGSIKGDADREFLLGFFNRNIGKPQKAEDHYWNALDIQPKMSKAKRELVKVLLDQNKYQKALELAKDNYENDLNNSYHVYAYFRCLVRKKGMPSREDIRTMRQLMENIKNNFSNKKDEFLAAMSLEYHIHVERGSDQIEIIQELKNALRRFPDSPNIKRIASEYQRKQSLPIL